MRQAQQPTAIDNNSTLASPVNHCEKRSNRARQHSTKKVNNDVTTSIARQTTLNVDGDTPRTSNGDVAARDSVRDASTFEFLADFGGTDLMTPSSSNAKDGKTTTLDTRTEHTLAVNAIASDLAGINIPQYEPPVSEIPLSDQRIVQDDVISLMSPDGHEGIMMPEKEYICMSTDYGGDSDDDDLPTYRTYRLSSKGIHTKDNNSTQGNKSGSVTPTKRRSASEETATPSKTRKRGESSRPSSRNFQPIRPAQPPRLLLRNSSAKALRPMAPSTHFGPQAVPAPVFVTAGPYGTSTTAQGMPMLVYPPQTIGPVFVGHHHSMMPQWQQHSAADGVIRRPQPLKENVRTRRTESVSSKDSASDEFVGEKSGDSKSGEEEKVKVQPPAKLEHHSMFGRLQLDDGALSTRDCSPDGNGGGRRKSKSRSRSQNDAPKKRLVWSNKLHERFVKAVRAAGGIDKAVPRQLLKHMNVDGLTSEHVKSHLQKYRNTVKKNKEFAKLEEANIEASSRTGDVRMMLKEGIRASLEHVMKQQAGFGGASSTASGAESVVGRKESVSPVVSRPQERMVLKQGEESERQVEKGTENESKSRSTSNVQDGEEKERQIGEEESVANEKRQEDVEMNGRLKKGVASESAGSMNGSRNTSAQGEQNGEGLVVRQREQAETQLALQEHTMRLQFQMQVIVHRMVTLQRKIEELAVRQNLLMESGRWSDFQREQKGIVHESRTVQRELERQQELLKGQMQEQEKLRMTIVDHADSTPTIMKSAVDGVAAAGFGNGPGAAVGSEKGKVNNVVCNGNGAGRSGE